MGYYTQRLMLVPDLLVVVAHVSPHAGQGGCVIETTPRVLILGEVDRRFKRVFLK